MSDLPKNYLDAIERNYKWNHYLDLSDRPVEAWIQRIDEVKQTCDARCMSTGEQKTVALALGGWDSKKLGKDPVFDMMTMTKEQITAIFHYRTTHPDDFGYSIEF